MNGTFNEWIAGNGFSEEIETPEFLLANLEKWAVRAYNQYAAGWAWPMCTRFSGPSRWPRIGAGPATARSSTGRGGSARRAGCTRSSAM